MYKIFIPKSNLLKKHIESFYVMEKFEGEINYLAFPQVGMTMAFFISAEIKLEGEFISIDASNNSKAKILLLGKYKLPIQFKYLKSIPEISINFTPTGLNYFFKENASELTNKQAQFIYEEKWIKITSHIFNQDCNEDKIDVLESFLIDNLVGKDLSVVENYISLANENIEATISDIAIKLEVSAKTITRNFAKYIGCSPMAFKQILRFRKAIQSKMEKPLEHLTQIGFDSNFYDSPHFTREFKKRSHMNPRDFFADVKSVADKDIPYKFL